MYCKVCNAELRAHLGYPVTLEQHCHLVQGTGVSMGRHKAAQLNRYVVTQSTSMFHSGSK